MVLSSFRQKLFGTGGKEIPLNLLSHLWVEKEVSEQAALQDPTNDWAHQDVHQFYNQYIAPNMTALGTAVPVIHQILAILDNAGDWAADMDDSEEEKMPVSTTTLREHSFCVARIAVDMIKKTHRDYDMILGKILIICIGHGLGALSSSVTIGGVMAKTLLILDPMIQDLPFKQDIVLAILTFGENHPKAEAAKILKAASCAARKKEVESAQVFSEIRQPDVLDIKKIRAAIQPPLKK